jgi:hypothetical protein
MYCYRYQNLFCAAIDRLQTSYLTTDTNLGPVQIFLKLLRSVLQAVLWIENCLSRIWIQIELSTEFWIQIGIGTYPNFKKYRIRP